MTEYEERKAPIERYCANCGKLIEHSFVKVLDNFLQVKYFDSDEDNCFCSSECLLESIFACEMIIDENGKVIDGGFPTI